MRASLETLTPTQISFFHQRGYLHLPGVFAAEETAGLTRDLDWMIEDWAERTPGWNGPWRSVYMRPEVERSSELIAMHDLHLYSEAWMRAVTRPDLAAAVSQLVEGPVELHHTTMHVKPPETGHPFPTHQDWAFYEHDDARFVAALVHLDDTGHENGEIRFIAGSHLEGPLEHITSAGGEPCSPHLPTDRYSLEDTVAVPARAGDVVFFSIHTIHGSYINQTSALRRMVRVGYRHPENIQRAGQSHGRPGLMVRGARPRRPGQPLFGTGGPS